MNITIKKHSKSLIKHSIAELKPFAKDSLWAYHPCVLKRNDTYFMFYTGKSLGKGISHHTLLAKSKDLKNWEKIPRLIIGSNKEKDWDNDFTAHAFVFQDNDKYYMLYDGSRKGNWSEEIGLAESKDLLIWNKYNSNPIFSNSDNWWEKRHVSRCCAYKQNGEYYLYYTGHDGEWERIGLARGRELTDLKRVSDKPIIDQGEKGEWDEVSVSDPRIIRYKKQFLLIYSGVDIQGKERTGMAISRDLMYWEKYRKNPILDLACKEQISASRADIRIFDNKIYLFYSSRNKYFYDIKLAEIEIRD